MRILIDTNIVLSAALFPGGRISALLKEILPQHALCICTFSLDELFLVVARKFPEKRANIDAFLSELSFELIYTPATMNADHLPALRDKNDMPILLSAVEADVDVLLSGDKDFSSVEIMRPLIMHPAEFRERYL